MKAASVMTILLTATVSILAQTPGPTARKMQIEQAILKTERELRDAVLKRDTTIALHLDNADMEIEHISMKLFGNDGEDMSEDDYFECFFNLDLPSGFAFWNEKDPDYREPLIRGLCHSE